MFSAIKFSIDFTVAHAALVIYFSPYLSKGIGSPCLFTSGCCCRAEWSILSAWKIDFYLEIVYVAGITEFNSHRASAIILMDFEREKMP